MLHANKSARRLGCLRGFAQVPVLTVEKIVTLPELAGDMLKAAIHLLAGRATAVETTKKIMDDFEKLMDSGDPGHAVELLKPEVPPSPHLAHPLLPVYPIRREMHTHDKQINQLCGCPARKLARPRTLITAETVEFPPLRLDGAAGHSIECRGADVLVV